jgi:mannose-6-phosphate isomerase-like protein (cupin superfamily)
MRRHLWVGLAVAVLMVAASVRSQSERSGRATEPTQTRDPGAGRLRPYTADLFQATEANTDYRRVLFTGTRSQLVVMSIPPGESIGREKHERVEQMIVIVGGSGQVTLDGRRTNVGGGDVIVVTPGTEHDLRNTGRTPLQLFTTYVPPNHIDGRVHRTRRDAERDVDDERFGQRVE